MARRPTLTRSRKRLAQQQQLGTLLSELHTAAAKGDVDSALVTSSVEAICGSLPGLLEHIPRKHRNLIVPEHCPEHAKAVTQRVFDIPELLEMILTHLTIQQLLRVQSVNRQFRDAVGTSTKLQRQLCLLPNSSPYVSTAFVSGYQLQGVSQMVAMATRPSDPPNSLRVTTWFDGYPIAKITAGLKCRRMLVLQPTVTAVRAYTSCCSGAAAFD